MMPDPSLFPLVPFPLVPFPLAYSLRAMRDDEGTSGKRDR